MKISIITVSYNSEKTIERAIRSVVRQNYGDTEYILIDGGSSDRTADIIRKYEKKLSYWISERDEGIYDAMNKGLEHATGEIVAFLNSDDWYEDHIFVEIAEAFEEESVQLICGDMYIHRAGTVSRYHIDEKAAQRAVRFSMGYPHPTMFARRRLFDRYGKFDTRYRIAADYDWFLRVYDHNEKIRVLDRVVTNFSYGGVSTKEEMMPALLEEQERAALEALERNHTLTEKEKWRETIRSETANMRDSFKIQQILKDGRLDRNPVAVKVRELFRGEKCAVFGSGHIAVQLISILRKMDVSVTRIWDNREQNWGKRIEGIQVMKPDQIKIRQNVVVIASVCYESEIEKQLKGYGLEKNTHYLFYRELRKLIVDAVEAGPAESDVMQKR